MSVEETYRLNGPVLLLAGPGTGKTYALGRRLKYLINEENVPPDEITVITFTAAAAQNMRDCISDESNADLYIEFLKQPRRICTMHSLGYSIIREHAKELGLGDDVKLISEDYLRSLIIEDAAQLTGREREDAKATITCRQTGGCNRDQSPKCEICEKYKDIMKICSAIDHDEQILLACDVLRAHPRILERCRGFAKHLLVDEYQDINEAQHSLIRLLSEQNLRGLFVVGDDDQSIYSWRGGSPEYIRSFNRHFGDEARTIPLLKSYRCHRHVLEGSLGVVERNDPTRLPKGEFTYKREEGPKIMIHSAPTDEKEAREVRGIIERVLPARDVLVLFPNRQFSRAIVKELRAARIAFSAPTSIPGSGIPLVSVLAEWQSNTSDNLALRRIVEAVVESPGLGIPSNKARKPEKKLERENSLRRVAEFWQPLLDGKAGTLWEAVQQGSSAEGLASDIHTALKELLDRSQDAADLEGLLVAVAKHLSPWRKPQDFLSEASSWVEAVSYAGPTGQKTNVRLMTFQGAKGLEAEVVCLIGLEDGVIPRNEPDVDIAEQARLLFVSMTRAKGELHLFHARKRSSYVLQRNIYQKDAQPDLSRSRFLDSIPQEHYKNAYHKY